MLLSSDTRRRVVWYIFTDV